MGFGEGFWLCLGGVRDDHKQRVRAPSLTVSDAADLPAPAPQFPATFVSAAVASAFGTVADSTLSSYTRTVSTTARAGLHSFPSIEEMESFSLLGRGGSPSLGSNRDNNDDLYEL